MVLDADLRMRYVSDSCESVFGFTPRAARGRGLEVFGGAGAETLSEALERARQQLRAALRRVAWKLTDTTGRTRCAESTITNLLADPIVGGFVLNTRDDTDRVALADQLRDQAFHDPLTGLPNRALLGDRASQAFARSQRTGGRGRDDGGRPRRLQARQRRLRARRRRSAAARRRRAAAGERCARRTPSRGSAATSSSSSWTRAPTRAAALALAERIRAGAAPRPDVSRGPSTASPRASGSRSARRPHTNFDQLLCDADVALYCVKRAGTQRRAAVRGEHERQRARAIRAADRSPQGARR